MKIALFANTDWYMYNFNRSLACALRDGGHEVILITPDGDYGGRMTEMGFRWIIAPMNRRSINLIREIRFVIWLRKLLFEEKVDIVHSFTVKCSIYGSIASRWSCVSAQINAISGLGFVFANSGLLARFLRPLVRRLLRFSLSGAGTKVIVLNKDDFALFVNERLVHPSKLIQIPGAGVDCSRFSPFQPSRRLANSLSVVLPARLLWDKGIAEFVEAARILKSQDRDIEFMLAGASDSGNPASVPEQILRSWEMDGIVRLLGHVDDMPTLFRSCDVVVLPSYREGLPTGLTEAAACGKALVTTDVPGCREVVTNDVDGLVVPVKNAIALANAIARLQDDPALRMRLGSAARTRALAEFDEQIVIRRTLEVYEKSVIKS